MNKLQSERLGRLLTRGPGALSTIEIIEDVLDDGELDVEVRTEMARSLWFRKEGEELRFADYDDLEPVLGKNLAYRMVLVLELGRRVAAKKIEKSEIIHHSRQLHEVLRPHLQDLRHEVFLVALLDSKHRFMGMRYLASGGYQAVIIDHRMIFRTILATGAPSVVFVHNHPSGSPQPSADDVQVTRDLVDGARILGIKALDHLIVSREGYFSFLDHNLLQGEKEG